MSFKRKMYPPTVQWRTLKKLQPTFFSSIKGLLIIALALFNHGVLANGLTAVPSSRDFGDIPVSGVSTEQTFTLTNTLSNSLQINPIQSVEKITTDTFGNITTVLSQEFLITQDPCSNTAAIPASNCQVTMQFKPKSAGAKEATLFIPYLDALGSPTSPFNLQIPLKGNGTNEPNIEANLTTHDFGTIKVGLSSNVQTILIFNRGKDNLQLQQVSLTGDDAQEFNLGDFCSGFSIREGKYCSLRATFKPQTTGIKKATISIPSNDPDTPLLNISLTGGEEVGPLVPNITVNPVSQDFGSVSVSKTSLYKTITISNIGSANLQLGQISLSGNEFTGLDNTCSNKKLEASGRCFMNVRFEPKSEGSKTGVLSIASNDPDNPTVNVQLTGTATPPTPNIKVEPMSHDFGEVNVGSVSDYQKIVISNTGKDPLDLGTITLPEGFTTAGDYCSDKTIGPAAQCIIAIRFEPKSLGEKKGILSIPSNDPDTPTVEVSLMGTGSEWCGTNAQKGFSGYPNLPDFGTIVVGGSQSLRQSINTWARGCGALKVDTITVTGNDQAEFKIQNKQCYDGYYAQNDNSYSNCQLTVVFSPTSEGTKSAEITVKFVDDSVKTLALRAKAVKEGQAKLESSPDSYDFGESVIDRIASPQIFTFKNTGNINLKLDTIRTTGTDASEFGVKWSSCFYQQILRPSEQCQLQVKFSPRVAGDKEANLTVVSNAANELTKDIPLKGKALDTGGECASDNVTIETTGSSWDHRWAEKISGNYNGPTYAWKRLKNFENDDELETPNRPKEDDVVLIKNGHSIEGIPLAKVKALCVENGGQLESLNLPPGSPLEIIASQYVENKGDILGNNGADETPDQTSCTDKDKVGIGNCAYPGANVILKVGQQIQNYGKAGDQWWYSYASGGPILNEGQIKAGHGGDASQYAGAGGDAIVLGRNTSNKGAIKGGHGGDILGLEVGEAGHGGLTQIWGKLGGAGNLYNTDGAQAFAGDGGNCNPDATASQIGGRGGNLWLVSLPDVYLNGGQHHAGKGGNKCEINGQDGWVRIEPNTIDLSQAQTEIDGGDVAIHGGDEWTLDLSQLSGTVVTATGDIVLAVGQRGVVDLRKSSGKILKAEGQVYIFADIILLDEGVKLSDLIEASNIVVGPSQVLHEVSLIGPGHYFGEPGQTLSMNLTLSNNGPEKDTYTIIVADSKGWDIGPLPSTISVNALESIDLVLSVRLPEDWGKKDLITVTAISEFNPEIAATTEITVAVPEIEMDSEGGSGWNIPNGISEETDEVELTGNECPSNGVVDRVCKNSSERVLQGVTIKKNASVAGGIFKGTNNNQGMASQFTLAEKGIFAGGIVTGRILNRGLMADFIFKGKEVVGGTLAGDVFNESEVEGVFKDVSLAPNTRIKGGFLAGDIAGDCEAPARLEDLTVKANSSLSCVILSDNVVLGAGVTCGKGVTPKAACSSETTDDDDNDEIKIPDLPELEVVATNTKGETVETTSRLFGGLAVNGGSFKRKVEIKLSDMVDIQGYIIADSQHVNERVDIVVFVAYQPLKPTEGETVYFMLNEKGQVLLWDENLAHLDAFKKNIVLDTQLELPLYEGEFASTGILDISLGYRLKDGTVVSNSQTIEVTIKE